MSAMSIDKHDLAEAFCAIAERAGHEILRVYHGEFEVRDKADFSPVTDADERAEQLIIENLSRIAPEIPVVAEESVAAGRIPDIGKGPFFLVDPLDGTKEFVSRNGEFTVNIALIENACPVLGVVHLPVLTETYWTSGDGEAWRNRRGERAPIRCRTPGDELVAVASRSHSNPETDEYLSRFPIKERISAGSSLKFCRIAEGVADIYPRIGRTMEWDIAAGHAVLNAAGGCVMTLEGVPLRYGKTGFENPPIVARGLEQ
jgi:3'(2'), 5'-bisphosphate nucleotidase